MATHAWPELQCNQLHAQMESILSQLRTSALLVLPDTTAMTDRQRPQSRLAITLWQERAFSICAQVAIAALRLHLLFLV